MDSSAQDSSLYESMIKLLIIGGPQVGKSSLVSRFCNNTFSSSYTPTTGVHFKYKMLDFDSKKVKVQVWDTAGTDHSNALLKIYYKKAMGILLVFSMSDKQSLEELEKWMQSLQSNANPNAIIVLVGNKTDVSERAIGAKDIKAFQKKYKVDKYVETNVKEGSNANEIFTELVKEVKERIEKGSFKADQNASHPIANQEIKPALEINDQIKEKAIDAERDLLLEKEKEENMNKKVEKLVEVAKKEMSFELEEIRKITRDELDMRLQEEFERFKRHLIDDEKKKAEESNKEIRDELSFLRRAFENLSQLNIEEISQSKIQADQTIANLVKENTALEERLSKLEKQKTLQEERDLLINVPQEEVVSSAQKRKQWKTGTAIMEIDTNIHRSSSDKGSQSRKVREASFDKTSRDPNESTRHCSNSTEIFYAGGKKTLENNDRKVILDSLETERIWEQGSPKKCIYSALPHLYNAEDDDIYKTVEELQDNVAVLMQEVKRMQGRISNHECGKHGRRHGRKTRENKSCQYADFGATSEIGRLWETINSLVKNTHEEIDKVKEEVKRSKSKKVVEMRNALVERNMNGSIRELRDDIHNQLIEIQRDLESKYGVFRNNLTMNYESFLKYFHTEQNKLKDFMEERCFEIIEEALRAQEKAEDHHILISKKSLSDTNSPTHDNETQKALETIEEMKKKKSLALTIVNIEAQQKQMLSSYTNSFKSVWETIEMLADKINGLDSRGSYIAEISRKGGVTSDYVDWRRMEF